MGTIDGRLFALDMATGELAAGFGENGVVDLKPGVGRVDPGHYSVSSPPAVVNNTIVVGSAIGDNRRVQTERGIVRAFDARSGALLWSWDPIPRSADREHWNARQPQSLAEAG